MKKKILSGLGLISALMLTITSCSTEDYTTSNKTEENASGLKTLQVSVKASVGSDDATSRVGYTTDAGAKTWETGDAIIIYDNANTANKASTLTYNASTGKFTGTVYYTAETDVLQAYVKDKNASSAVTFDTATGTVTVNLQNQDGTYADALRHDLLKTTTGISSLRTSAAMTFARTMAFAKFTFNKGNGVNATKVSLQASNAASMYSTLKYNLSDGSSVSSGTIAGAPSATIQATGTTYLAFPAGSYTGLAVHTNYTYSSLPFLSVHTLAAGSYNYQPSKYYTKTGLNVSYGIGDFLCNGSGYPIAIVFMTSTGTEDTQNGYSKGYALALQDASMSSNWGDNMGYVSSPNDYTYYFPVPDYMDVSLSDYPAIMNAQNYSVVRPGSASLWYLPCSAHWARIVENLGGLNAPFITENTISWSANNVSTINSRMALSNASTDLSGIYWTCNEDPSGLLVYSINFSGANTVISEIDSNSNCKVRSVIAF